MPICPVAHLLIIPRSGIPRRTWDEKVTFDFQGGQQGGENIDDEVQLWRGLLRSDFLGLPASAGNPSNSRRRHMELATG